MKWISLGCIILAHYPYFHFTYSILYSVLYLYSLFIDYLLAIVLCFPGLPVSEINKDLYWYWRSDFWLWWKCIFSSTRLVCLHDYVRRLCFWPSVTQTLYSRCQTFLWDEHHLIASFSCECVNKLVLIMHKQENLIGNDALLLDV